MLEQELDGLRAELIDDESVEVFSFNGSSIAATLGTKSGPVTAPIVDYEVTGINSIIIRGLFPIIWENIEFNEGFIRVKRNGSNATYKTTKRENASKKRKLP